MARINLGRVKGEDGIQSIQDATDVDTTAIADDKILVAKAITGGFKHVYEDKPTGGGGKEWQLQFFNQTDIIQLEATSGNIAIFASGVGTDVGSIEVSNDGVTYIPLLFPFSPSVGLWFFKRSVNLVTGVYTISE